MSDTGYAMEPPTDHEDEYEEPKPLTWGEFKAKMENATVKDETVISHIDWNGDTEPDIHFYPDGSVRIY